MPLHIRRDNAGVSLICDPFYGKAIQGAFWFHKIEKAENPDYKTPPKWVYFTGIPVLVIFLALGLTQARVILYMDDENEELQVYEQYFDAIASVELIRMGNSLEDSIYKIQAHAPDAWLQIALSAENMGDRMFIEALQSKIEENGYLQKPGD